MKKKKCLHWIRREGIGANKREEGVKEVKKNKRNQKKTRRKETIYIVWEDKGMQTKEKQRERGRGVTMDIRRQEVNN